MRPGGGSSSKLTTCVSGTATCTSTKLASCASGSDSLASVPLVVPSTDPDITRVLPCASGAVQNEFVISKADPGGLSFNVALAAVSRAHASELRRLQRQGAVARALAHLFVLIHPDSGCTGSVTPDESVLINRRKCNDSFSTAS